MRRVLNCMLVVMWSWWWYGRIEMVMVLLKVKVMAVCGTNWQRTEPSLRTVPKTFCETLWKLFVKLTGRELNHPWGRCQSRPGPSPPSPASSRSPAKKIWDRWFELLKKKLWFDCFAPPLSSRRTPWHAQGWTWLATENVGIRRRNYWNYFQEKGFIEIIFRRRYFPTIVMSLWCPVFCVLVSCTASKFKTNPRSQRLHWNISRSGRTGAIRNAAKLVWKAHWSNMTRDICGAGCGRLKPWLNQHHRTRVIQNLCKNMTRLCRFITYRFGVHQFWRNHFGGFCLLLSP